MLQNLRFWTFLISWLLSTASFAMEENFNWFDAEKIQNIRFEKQGELDQIIWEYEEAGKPIGLAVACGSWEMPMKIRNAFGSNVSAIENWIALDLYLTDSDHYRGGPHIRMDARNAHHWQQVANYLKENNVEVQTVALTIPLPTISSPILHDIILPLVKKGGMVVYPQCFRSGASQAYVVQGIQFIYEYQGFHEDQGFKKDLARRSYMNKEELMRSAMSWIGKSNPTMRAMDLNGEAEKRFEAKVYVNRVVSFKEDYLNKGEVLRDKIRCLGNPTEQSRHLFSKTEMEFTNDFLGFFKEYMAEAHPSISYKIYYSSNEIGATLDNAEEYVYPQDGTFKLTGYGGHPSVVIIKQ